MSVRENRSTPTHVTTRRHAIFGVASVSSSLARRSNVAWAGSEEEISRTAESIHQEAVFKASRKRVYEALTDTKQFDRSYSSVES